VRLPTAPSSSAEPRCPQATEQDRGGGRRRAVVVPEALHARPASLLARLAASFDAKVTLIWKSCTADVASILEVLALGVATGELVEVQARGVDAEKAASAIHELIERRFDGDLVPERGEGRVAGIGVGRALVFEPGESLPVAQGSVAEELARFDGALARVQTDLRELLASVTPSERPLFAPASLIVQDLGRLARGSIEKGSGAERAVHQHTEGVAIDLVRDVRARLLDALAGGDAFARAFQDLNGEERILVTRDLVPSLVALAPRSIVGIVASQPEGGARSGAWATSHASVLAHGRSLPLVMVPEHVTQGIVDNEWVVFDARKDVARVWVAPSDELVGKGRRHLEALRASSA